MSNIKIFISKFKNKTLYNWAVKNNVPIKKDWTLKYYITVDDLISYNCDIITKVEDVIDYMDVNNARKYKSSIMSFKI